MSTRTCCVAALVGALLAACAGVSTSHTAEHLMSLPKSGFVPVDGGRVFYSIEGTGKGTPLLVLHGGPGIPHDYLANLAELGEQRPVVFYDQLGCGRSDRPTDPSLWTIARFVEELGQVRQALGLDEVILYGHSWGSILATSYMMTHPSGVKGLILAGPALSIPRWSRDASQLVDGLDAGAKKAIRDAEISGHTDSKEYEAAMGVFYSQHLCRLDPWPQPLQDAMAGMNQDIYVRMNGPSEFALTGTLKDFDITPKLGTLHVPTLVICGQYDEARPQTSAYYASLIPGATFVEIKDAADRKSVV